MARRPIVLTWGQIVHSLDAMGYLAATDKSKTSAFEIRKRLLGTGRVKQIARGRYELLDPVELE
jgi:hypothetical protein